MDYLLIASTLVFFIHCYGVGRVLRGRYAPIAYGIAGVLSATLLFTAAVTDRPILLILNLASGAAAVTLSIIGYRRQVARA